MLKKKIEIFTNGCPKCEDALSLVNSVACENCEIKVWDVSQGCEANECEEKAKNYGLKKYPAVVVDGKPLDCCADGGPTAESLALAGVGGA